MRKNSISIFSLLFLSCFLLPRTYADSIFKEPFTEYHFECGTASKQLVLSTNSDPRSFNPVTAQETSTTQFTSYMFEGLTRTDPLTLEVLPNLAKSWETEDSIHWVFHLRDDVFFSDGTRFTADDVVFTFNDLIYNPDIPTSSRDIFLLEGKKIRVEKIDDYTVSFTLPSLFAPFLRACAQEILPAHKYAGLVKNNKFAFSLGLDSMPKDIVGSGPFRLKKYLPGERVILEKNPYYWKKDACNQRLPYFEKIVFIIVPNRDTELLKFLEGETDYYGVRAQDIGILGPKQAGNTFTLYNAGPTFASTFLVLNQDTETNSKTQKPFVKPYKLQWFRDKNFRKALSYAIDRQKIITIALNGLGIPQYSAESPSNKVFYTPDVVQYPYEPLRAQEMLLSMGLRDRNNDGILEDKEGNAVEINFFTNANDTERTQVASLIKKDLESIGIKVNFLPLDFNNLVNKLLVSHDWEMILIGLSGGVEPYFGKNVWSYKGTMHMWNPTGKACAPYEEEIETLFNTSVKTLDEQKRKELFGQFQKITSEELPLIYTVIPYSLYAVANKFGNLFPTVSGGAFSEIEYVYITPQTRKEDAKAQTRKTAK